MAKLKQFVALIAYSGNSLSRERSIAVYSLGAFSRGISLMVADMRRIMACNKYGPSRKWARGGIWRATSA